MCGMLVMSPKESSLGFKIIPYAVGALYLVYIFSRKRNKKWGYFEMKWRLLPSAFLFFGLAILLLLAWNAILN
jgi:hypothetical protein